MNKYVFGVDFGTDSVRSLLVNALNGEEIATSVFYYPRWKNQLCCHPDLNQFQNQIYNSVSQSLKGILIKMNDWLNASKRLYLKKKH